MRGQISLQQYIIRVVVLLFSLCVHEYSHARAAYRLGDDTAAHMGRLTLDPRAHLEPIGALLIFLGAPVAWAKPVPVNPNRFRKMSATKGFALVSVAGPLSNIVLAIASCLIYSITGYIYLTQIQVAGTGSFFMSLLGNTATVFYVMYMVNIMLAVFNLLPVPPLDGSRIWSPILPPKAYNWLMQNERYIGMAFLAIFVLRPTWISWLINLVAKPLMFIIEKPISLLVSAVGSLF